MHHGHRGLNHPVKNLQTGKSEITSQNHGFAVSMESLEASDLAELTHLDLNDNTVEGLRIINKPALSVQHHPESSPGPHDSRYLFDDFVEPHVLIDTGQGELRGVDNPFFQSWKNLTAGQ